MTRLTLTNYVQGNATLLENEFIDNYMPAANGEYVKVYLLLLRYLGDPSNELSFSRITETLADTLDCTEKDIIRALNYWKKQGLLEFGGGTTELRKKTASPAKESSETIPAPQQETSMNTELLSQKNRREFREIIHVTEQYLGKTLSKTEADTIAWFYDELRLSADLIEYLIESCVENGHKSIHYIKKVALSWADSQITTVEEAKAYSDQYCRNSYAVLNAYGIKGRAASASEAADIRRWNEEYGFSCELILEACNRTMNAIHQPSFSYTESILRNWKDKGVKTLTDVRHLDLSHMQEQQNTKKQAAPRSTRTSRKQFNNFEGRTYQDMDELTRRLIES